MTRCAGQLRWWVVAILMFSLVFPFSASAESDDPGAIVASPVVPATELSATETPTTEPSPESAVPTDTPTATQTQVVEVPTSTDTPQAPTPTETPQPGMAPTQTTEVREPAPFQPAAVAPTGAMLTVDGQSGVAYGLLGGTQNFQVGDLLDMPSLVPDFINASNPDPDFYNFNGWWTSNTFFVYASPDCSGHWIREFYNSHMQPEEATDSASLTGAVRTYSVQASQTLTVWWLEKKIDIVDSVDEVNTYPARATSNCVTVHIRTDYINLLANGSVDPVTINEGSPLGLQTDQPTGDGWVQKLLLVDSSCAGGKLITQSNAGETVSTTVYPPPGTYRYLVQAVKGTDSVFTNCVQVTVQQTPASLKAEGSLGPVLFVTGQSLALYVQGFPPNANLTGVVYPGSTDCQGWPAGIASGTADSSGTLDTTAIFGFETDLSVKFLALGIDGEVLESSNCVTLLHQISTIHLTVNGSVGPVLVGGGEIHLIATGLPEGSVAHAVVGCDGPFEPEDFGQVIGSDGMFEMYLSDDLPDFFSVRVALAPPSEVSSNCVQVRLVPYLIDPEITINDSLLPVTVEYGGSAVLGGIDFPPETPVIVWAHVGSSTCEGEGVIIGLQSDVEGLVQTELDTTTPGPVSFWAESGQWDTNCVSMIVGESPPVEEPEGPEVPTGPITLTANGQSDPLELESGARADLTAENLGDADPYHVYWYPDADCSGTQRTLAIGAGSSGLVGAMTRYISSSVGFQLETATRTSNCVEVSWRADAATPSDPTNTPDTGATSTPAAGTDPTATPDNQESTATVPPTTIPSATPADTTPTPTTGSIVLTLTTSDGNSIPDTGLLCMDGNCTPVGDFVNAAFRALAVSGSTFTFENLVAGSHTVSITGISPYMDAEMAVDVVAGETTAQNLVLQISVQQEPTATQPAVANPTQSAGESVVELPSTGTGGDSGTWILPEWTLAALLAGLGIVLMGAVSDVRHRRRIANTR